MELSRLLPNVTGSQYLKMAAAKPEVLKSSDVSPCLGFGIGLVSHVLVLGLGLDTLVLGNVLGLAPCPWP